MFVRGGWSVIHSYSEMVDEPFSESRVVVGGLNAPNLLQELCLLSVALECDERCSGRTRGGTAGSSAGSRSDARNRATQRFRQYVVETDGEPKQDDEERNDIAPKQWLVQIKIVDNHNAGELQSDERECVLRGGNQFIFIANVDSHGHEHPIQPCKRDGHFEGGKHTHIGVFQGNKLPPHGRRLGANERRKPKKIVHRGLSCSWRDTRI